MNNDYPDAPLRRDLGEPRARRVFVRECWDMYPGVRFAWRAGQIYFQPFSLRSRMTRLRLRPSPLPAGGQRLKGAPFACTSVGIRRQKSA